MLRQLFHLFFGPDKQFVRNIRHICGFVPKNVFLYKLAMTHSSSVRKGSEAGAPALEMTRYTNERLEFLGDSILDAVVAEYLFKKYPTRDEGFLTEMRSKIVNRKSLNRICQQLQLSKLLIHNQGGSANESMFGDALEALIGAVFIDVGYEKSRRFIIQRLIAPNLDLDDVEQEIFSYKNKLLEYIQKEKLGKISFEVVSEQGEGVRKTFIVNVMVGEAIAGTGEGRNKKTAEQHAAEDALARMKVI